MKTEVLKAWARRKDPIVLDRKIDIYFFILWALYAGWGTMSAIIDVTILDVPLQFYPTIWGGIIGISALVACGSILTSFFIASDHFRERIAQKRVEVIALVIMGMMIAVYPVLQVFRLITDLHGTTIDSVILSFSYLVMIAFRIQFQSWRAQQVKIAMRRYLESGEDRPRDWSEGEDSE